MAVSKMYIEQIGETLVTVGTPGDASDEDIDRMISAATNGTVKQLFCYMDGSVKVNPTQRKRSRDALIKFRTIAVAGDAWVRSIGKVVQWFGGSIEMYSPEQLKQAARALNVSAIETSKVILFCERKLREKSVGG